MTLPNFVGCGAGRSGTTSLTYYLNQHPDICMSPQKETDYFSLHYAKGEAWYASHFRTCGESGIVGEFSPTYLVQPHVPARIAGLLPQAKLLFLLRNPVERAFSSYWFAVSTGLQPRGQTFSEAIRHATGHAMHVEGGLYFQHLTRFLQHFPMRQIRVMFSEELRQDPLGEMARCFQFLGADTAFAPDASHVYNITGGATAAWGLLSYRYWVCAKNQARKLILWMPGTVRERFAVLESGLRVRLFRGDRPPMPEADRAYLQEVYAPENEKLANLLERRLPWV